MEIHVQPRVDCVNQMMHIDVFEGAALMCHWYTRDNVQFKLLETPRETHALAIKLRHTRNNVIAIKLRRGINHQAPEGATQ